MKEDGCNKAALGHHREDVVDTFLLSLLYEGRLHTFQPITDLSDIGLTVIRPLIYCPEKEIIDFKNRYQIPILHNTCPEDGYTKRQEMDDLLRSLNKKDHLTTTRILTAIQESGIDGWHPGVNYRTQKREK
jgi:tRNA 2-thiocytidine biosynthesis protein TtcA